MMMTRYERKFSELLEKFLIDEVRDLSDIDIEDSDGLYYSLLKYFDREMINYAYEKSKGNKMAAARILGINRNTFDRKFKLFFHCEWRKI